MTLLFTLDASVFIAACRSEEPGHKASRNLLTLISESGIPMIEPAILPVEVAAALARTGTNHTHAHAFANSILDLPNFTLVIIDEFTAKQAGELAARLRLRGADSLYITAAVRYGSRLVTLDHEQLQRAPSSTHAIKPDAALKLFR